MTLFRKVQLMFADYSKGVKSPSDKNSSDYPNPEDGPPVDIETFSARNRAVGRDFTSRSRGMRVNADFIRMAVAKTMRRGKGKLAGQKAGRARSALPPRK